MPKKYSLEISKFQEEDFENYYSLLSNKKVIEKIAEQIFPLEAKAELKRILVNNNLHLIIWEI